MKLIERNGLRILVSDYGKRLYNEKIDMYTNRVYLGKNASPNDYREEIDPNAIPDLVVELDSVHTENDVQNDIMDTTMMALDEIFMIFEPLLAMVPITMSINEMEVKNPMVELYVVMIQRGLKELEDVPERYRDQVAALLEEIEN